MNRTKLAAAAMAVALSLAGCGGGEAVGTIPVYQTRYLQSWDDVNGRFVGVSDVDWQCGPDSGTTDASGAFTYMPGDDCTFYGLDDTLSLSTDPDELYLRTASTVGGGVENVPYRCLSGIAGRTESDGYFRFDPDYPDGGDECTFAF